MSQDLSIDAIDINYPPGMDVTALLVDPNLIKALNSLKQQHLEVGTDLDHYMKCNNNFDIFNDGKHQICAFYVQVVVQNVYMKYHNDLFCVYVIIVTKFPPELIMRHHYFLLVFPRLLLLYERNLLDKNEKKKKEK